MITEIRQQSNSVLTYSSLFPAHRCPSTIKFKIRLQNARAWIDQTSFQFLRLTFWQIKWTECKKWKRNSEKFNFWLNLFLWFRINYSWNWECFDQSCVNRTETVHGTLRFLYLSHPLYGIWLCENLHYESVYFKELHSHQEYCWPTRYRAGQL